MLRLFFGGSERNLSIETVTSRAVPKTEIRVSKLSYLGYLVDGPTRFTTAEKTAHLVSRTRKRNLTPYPRLARSDAF